MDVKKGTIKAFDPATYKVTIQVAGSLSVWLEGIAVARNIPSAEMVAGRSCALVLFDPGNPQDSVVIAVYT